MEKDIAKERGRGEREWKAWMQMHKVDAIYSNNTPAPTPTPLPPPKPTPLPKPKTRKKEKTISKTKIRSGILADFGGFFWVFHRVLHRIFTGFSTRWFRRLREPLSQPVRLTAPLRGPRKGEWPLWGEEKPRHRWNFPLAENGTLWLVLRRGEPLAYGIRVRFEIICIDFICFLGYKYNVEIHPFYLCKKI